MGFKEAIAVDIETTGLNFMENKIRLISAYSTEVELVTEDVSGLKEVLEDPQIVKVFHNAPFDVSFLKEKGIEVVNYTDTFIMAQVLENKVRGEGRSLAFLSEKYLKINMDKTLQDASNWGDEITEEHRKYALKDAKVTYLLYQRLMKFIAQKGLSKVLQREIAALPVITHLQVTGFKFDFSGWEEILAEISEKTENLKKTIREIVGNDHLNLESPKQLLKMLKGQGVDAVATNDDELKKHEGNHEVVSLLRKYKKKKKNLSAFGSKLKAAIGSDGRLRGNWSLVGTDTGRMGCCKPPMQAMPRKSRPYFKAEKGHSLILADYKTIELRILAVITKDPELLKAFLKGEDLHKKTADTIFQKKSVIISEEERDVGKIINFGIVYGMSSFGIKKKVFSSTGNEISLVEAEDYRQNYFKLYKKVLDFQGAMLRACFIKTLGGRIWRNHELEKGSVKRYNYPIQAAMAEGLKESLILLLEELEKNKKWRIVNIIHDEIILEVPDSEVGIAKVVLEKTMIQGMKEIMGTTVPIEVDVDVREVWEEIS